MSSIFLSMCRTSADSSVTSVIAGRDITYRVTRVPVSGDLSQIDGALRSKDRDASTPRWPQFRSADLDAASPRAAITPTSPCPMAAPNVSITAGLAARQPDLRCVHAEIPGDGNLYDRDLRDYLEKVTGEHWITSPAALARFASLSEVARHVSRTGVARRVARGWTVGRAGGPGHKDYTRAFAALADLLPGQQSRPRCRREPIPTRATSGCSSAASTRSTAAISRCSLRVARSTPALPRRRSRSASTSRRSELGVVVQSTGSVNAVSFGDLQVNESRVFAADGGNILVWSTRGDIDAGRGAKTAISAPAADHHVRRERPTASEFSRGAHRQRHPDPRDFCRPQTG